MAKAREILKILLYRAKLLNFITKLRNRTYRILREGYYPRKFWDGWSDHYSNQKTQQKIDKSQYWLLKKIEELKPKNVLEIGCGFGRNLRFLLNHLSYPVVMTGFDISESMIRKAKENLNNRALLGCADINALPLFERSYELVFTHAILMHVSERDIENAIREISRVVQKHLIIIEETYWSVGNFQGTLFKPNEYTFIYDYPRLLSKCGLKIIEMKEEKGDLNLIYFLCSNQEPSSQ
jgi:SAM-dependent methyltransferase